MDNRMRFTQEELQLLYAACMSYGDKLSEIIKSIPNEETDKLSDRAKDSWNLARKITGYMEGQSMEFRSCIRDELGRIVWWCDEHTHAENIAVLACHPEWYLSCEQIDY